MSCLFSRALGPGLIDSTSLFTLLHGLVDNQEERVGAHFQGRSPAANFMLVWIIRVGGGKGGLMDCVYLLNGPHL